MQYAHTGADPTTTLEMNMSDKKDIVLLKVGGSSITGERTIP